MKEVNLEDLEKYCVWIKVDRVLTGIAFIISLVYIIFYVVITILLISRPELIKPYLIYYYIGFPVFIITIWLAFKVGLFKIGCVKRA